MVEFDFRAVDWPESSVDAASHFYGALLPQIRELLAGEGMWADMAEELEGNEGIAVIFPPADHTHAAWRLAAIQELARAAAPLRVNGVACNENADMGEVIEYLASAPGVTGQMLVMDAIAGDNA